MTTTANEQPRILTAKNGEQVRDILERRSSLGATVMYYGVPHIVKDCGKQGYRITALTPDPTP